MTTKLNAMTAMLGMVICATIFTAIGHSECVSSPMQAKAEGQQQRNFVIQAAYRPGPILQVSENGNNDTAGAAIVGFWKFQFVAENSAPIPNGTLIDAGFAQWHSDGTEIMNSSRPPVTSNFCLGVWKKTGPFTYKLNHFALSWDLSGNPVGTANIREEVTLQPRDDTYTGIFTIDQFDTDGNTLAHIAGRVTGERITPD